MGEITSAIGGIFITLWVLAGIGGIVCFFILARKTSEKSTIAGKKLKMGDLFEATIFPNGDKALQFKMVGDMPQTEDKGNWKAKEDLVPLEDIIEVKKLEN